MPAGRRRDHILSKESKVRDPSSVTPDLLKDEQSFLHVHVYRLKLLSQ